MGDDIDDLDLDVGDDAIKEITEAKKSKLPLILAAAGLVVVLGGGGAAFMFMGGDDASAQKSAKANKLNTPVRAPAVYVKVDPEFQVTIQDSKGRKHYMRIEVSLMTHDAQFAKALEKNKPIIVNDLLNLFSNQLFENMLSVEGKKDLRTKALNTVKSTVKKEIGKSKIDAVLFTKFVME